MTSFEQLRTHNVARVPLFGHTLQSWNPLEWAGALCGEAGEAANVAKKLRRLQDGCAVNTGGDRRVLVEQLGNELADIIIYADLLAAREGIDLGSAVAAKFDEVSRRVGYPHRIADPVPDRPSADTTANPREAVVVKCDDGRWQIRTRDRKHWWSTFRGWSAWAGDQDEIDEGGNFRTKAAARAALAKAPPPPEVGTPSDATANPREVVVVQCHDGWWLVRTRDRTHWLLRNESAWWRCQDDEDLDAIDNTGNFGTEADARAALAKAPPPPEVGT